MVALWLDGLEHLPPKTVVVFTTNHLGRFSDRFVRRCEVYEFDGRSDAFRAGLAEFIRSVWLAETGEHLAEIPEGLGKFELADENYSIGLALQQISPYLRNRQPLPARFQPPIIRTTRPAARKSTPLAHMPSPKPSSALAASPAPAAAAVTIELIQAPRRL